MSHRVRVAVVIGQLTGGGAEKQTALLAGHIDRERFDLRVICFTEGGMWADYLLNQACPLDVIPRRGHYDFSRYHRLMQHFRRFRPHVVLAEMSDANVYATPAAVAVGVHGIVVGYRTVNAPWGNTRRWAERLLVPYVDVQLANAHAVARDTVAALGAERERTWVIYNALSQEDGNFLSRREARASLDLPADAFAVGFVASFSVEKDHATAVRAVAHVRESAPRLRLIMAGRGPQLEETRALAAELGVLDRCHFLGHRRDIVRHLRAFDVTVNCSHREGLCNAIIESLAAGVPVFASAVGGNLELVEPGVRGELFAAGDHEKLASLFAAGESGGIDLQRYGAEGARFSHRSFALEARIRETQMMFQGLAALPRRRPFARRGTVVRQQGVGMAPPANGPRGGVTTISSRD